MSDSGEKSSFPLGGKRILVTRAASQAHALVEPLQALGAVCVICPTIEIVPPDDPAELDHALGKLDQVDLLILSSPNAVDVFFHRCTHLGITPEQLAKITVVAVGPKTAQTIEEHGVKVDLIPNDFRAEGLVELLSGRVAGRSVLYPKAGLARDLVPKQLAGAGAKVLDPVAYTSRIPTGSADILAKALAQGLDLLTFTASSTVRNLMELLPPDRHAQVRAIPVASIGPLTSKTAHEMGFQVVFQPHTSTLEALIAAIKDYFGRVPAQT